MIVNGATMTASLGVAVGARARLVLQPVEGQVAVTSSQFPCLPFSSSSSTPYCASRLLRPRMDEGESTVGTSCSNRKLERGSAFSSGRRIGSYPTRESPPRRDSFSSWIPSGL